jgi:tRNA(fMet)-specific endonuclease VapC
MVLLDTDHMTLLERVGPEAARLKARLAGMPPDEVVTTIISYEEQTRGWMAYMAQARTEVGRIEAFRRLKRHIEMYCKIPAIDYDEKASAVFERLRLARIRIGTKDMQIAAIALANDAILLTRNLADFGKIPNLRTEDWSI